MARPKHTEPALPVAFLRQEQFLNVLKSLRPEAVANPQALVKLQELHQRMSEVRTGSLSFPYINPFSRPDPPIGFFFGTSFLVPFPLPTSTLFLAGLSCSCFL